MRLIIIAISDHVGLILFGIPVMAMRNRSTKYPFYKDEMYGFAEKKIRKMLESEDAGHLAKLFK